MMNTVKIQNRIVYKRRLQRRYALITTALVMAAVLVTFLLTKVYYDDTIKIPVYDSQPEDITTHDESITQKSAQSVDSESIASQTQTAHAQTATSLLAANPHLQDAYNECEGKRKIPRRRLCFADVAIEANDSAICKGLEEDSRAGCLGAIYSIDGDSSMCKNMQQDACYMGFGFGSAEVSTCSDIDDATNRDSCLFGVAVSTRDYTLCYGLEDEGYCMWYMARNVLKNATICLEAGMWQEDCLFRFAVKDSGISGITTEVCDELPFDQMIVCYALEEKDADLCAQSTLWADECYTRIAVATDDLSICENAGDKQEYCIWNVALERADATLCEQLSTKKELCYQDIARRTKNPELCEFTKDNKENCLFSVFTSLDLDAASCESLTNTEQCYFTMAERNADEALCEKSEKYQYYCYALVAEKKGDAALCEKAGKHSDICIIDVASSLTDVRICNSAHQKDVCIYTVVQEAVDGSDIPNDACDAAGQFRNLCYYELASLKNDKTLCDRAGAFSEDCRASHVQIDSSAPLPAVLETNEDTPLQGGDAK